MAAGPTLRRARAVCRPLGSRTTWHSSRSSGLLSPVSSSQGGLGHRDQRAVPATLSSVPRGSVPCPRTPTGSATPRGRVVSPRMPGKPASTHSLPGSDAHDSPSPRQAERTTQGRVSPAALQPARVPPVCLLEIKHLGVLAPAAVLRKSRSTRHCFLGGSARGARARVVGRVGPVASGCAEHLWLWARDAPGAPRADFAGGMSHTDVIRHRLPGACRPAQRAPLSAGAPAAAAAGSGVTTGLSFWLVLFWVKGEKSPQRPTLQSEARGRR